jgi:hypothetical protein
MQKGHGLDILRQLAACLGVALLLVLMLMVGSTSEAAAQGEDPREELNKCIEKAEAEMAAAQTFAEEVAAAQKLQDCLSKRIEPDTPPPLMPPPLWVGKPAALQSPSTQI